MLRPEVLDVSVLQRLRALQEEGQPDIVADVAGVFLGDVPGRLARIREAAGAGDVQTVERLAHSLKSSAAMLGARTLSRVSADVETRAREGRVDDPKLAELEQAFADTREALALLGLEATG